MTTKKRKQIEVYRPLGAIVKFPERVWEPCEHGGWITRPATSEDRERRRDLAEQLGVNMEVGE